MTGSDAHGGLSAEQIEALWQDLLAEVGRLTRLIDAEREAGERRHEVDAARAEAVDEGCGMPASAGGVADAVPSLRGRFETRRA